MKRGIGGLFSDPTEDPAEDVNDESEIDEQEWRASLPEDRLSS